MRRSVRTLVPALGLLAAAAAPARAQYQAYGLVNVAGAGQQLVTFNTANPTAVTLVGLTGQTLTGIDFRPATGELFGFNGSAVFTLSTATGAASQVGTGLGRTVSGNVGFDFNPTVDLIRLVGQDGTNLRVSPTTGGLRTVNGVPTPDAAYTYAAGDPGAGQAPVFGAVAYTFSDNNPATGTTLFGVDASRGTLVRIDNPNGGTVSTIGGGLGLGANMTVTGFDIVTVGSSNFAFLTAIGAGNNAGSSLYSVDLAAGTAVLVGSVGPATGNARLNVQGLAIASSTVPEPGTWALLATGLAGVVGVARRRRRTA